MRSRACYPEVEATPRPGGARTMTTSDTAPAPPHLDFDQIGPSVGSRFPDVRLPDQQGRLVDLHAARAGRKALVVFHRSAVW